MRTIKFRAYSKKLKCFVNDFVIDYLGNWYETNKCEFWGDDRDLIIMQFTGLLDKNGKEIYEGDVLSPGYADDELFVVVFDETKARFAEKRVSKKYPTHAGFIMDGSFLRSILSSQKIEIIGNIYENPELLTPQPER